MPVASAAVYEASLLLPRHCAKNWPNCNDDCDDYYHRSYNPMLIFHLSPATVTPLRAELQLSPLDLGGPLVLANSFDKSWVRHWYGATVIALLEFFEKMI